MMNRIVKSLLSLAIIGTCLAVVPAAAKAGLLVLATNPNPRHPPSDLLGEAVGWAIIGLAAGALSTIIGESLTMPEGRGFLIDHKGLILGGLIGLAVAIFLGTNFAVLQMDSVDGQAITSVNLGIISGAVVGSIGAISGIVLGWVLRRVVLALASLR